MSLIKPKHKHPHGPENTKQNEFRIWICEECDAVKTDEEIKSDMKENGGWITCKAKKYKIKTGCEAHFEPYLPDEKSIELT